MRGTFCFLIMLAGLPAVKAQIWCPPGAEWIMKPDFNLPMSGNSRVYYAGDTVLGGIPGQRLGAETFFVNWGDTVIQNSEVATGMVTSSTADVVSVWSIDSLTWDTLFWFSALPGDRWQAPHLHIVPGNPTEWIEVQDTATVVIDGMPLRQLNVVQVCEGNWPPDWGGQITERLGYWTPFNFPLSCGTASGFWELVCYNDSSISYTTGSGCDFLLSVQEPPAAPIVILPNPGTDHFTLELPPGAHMIEVFDALGQCMLSERSAGKMTVNTGSLEKGIYLVRVDGTRTARWLKQ